MDGHRYPPASLRPQPGRRGDVEFADQAVAAAKLCAAHLQVSFAAPFGDRVAERAEPQPLHVQAQQLEDVVGIGADGGYGEVEVEGEAALIAGVELAQCGAALEREIVEQSLLVQVAQQQILGDVD
ncbi:MAG: hypothetical protein QOK10_1217 [Pseudonocardiales bacterium]|jgi:hypothetical protein|nr:hypothetical protein [Pseudonocardiales bacterium]